jgi:hypothetical protein
VADESPPHRDESETRPPHVEQDDVARPFVDPPRSYALVSFVMLRLVALCYFVGFASAHQQIRALVGEHGLLPAVDDFARAAALDGGRTHAFFVEPSLFWLMPPTDRALAVVCVIGIALSFACLLGATNAIVQLVLWALYTSLLATGQIFYGYGWEIQLLETGLLTVFMCPVTSVRPFARAPPLLTIFLARWLIARIMLGAGLIKLRGDACWRDLSCLFYHYETQPNPSPLTPFFHFMPHWMLRLGVLFNHIVECIFPFGAFGPRGLRLVAGVGFVLLQITLIASGNLSFLNWLTLVPAIACFDDDALLRLVPPRWRARVKHASSGSAPSSSGATLASKIYAGVVALLSLPVVVNLLSPDQAMNRAFEPFHVVNTYGAFGSVSRVRHEIVIEGTSDETPSDSATWKEYEFPCKPGDPMRRPCLVTPWHYRLDWQMWFAAMSSYDEEPWFVELVAKLLRGDRSIEPLLAKDPFPDAPPRFIRARLYEYRLAPLSSRAWWIRSNPTEYMRPVSLGDPELGTFLDEHGLR